ncbi:MAG: oligosaccharide flippase family protein [Clostridium sp.]|nr:MAG: oligosaccharide flippase family protein [Clostridium sp.]
MLSQIITLLVPLISTPYVSRILHEDGVGQASFSLAMISYFTLFASLGFASYGQREIAKYQNESEKNNLLYFMK